MRGLKYYFYLLDQPAWCEQKVNCSNYTVSQICHATCKNIYGWACPSISCIEAPQYECCLDNSTNFLKIKDNIGFMETCEGFKGYRDSKKKPTECLDIMTCARSVKGRVSEILMLYFQS